MLIKGYYSNVVFEFNLQKICKYGTNNFLGLYIKKISFWVTPKISESGKLKSKWGNEIEKIFLLM